MQRGESEKNERRNSLFFNAHSFTHVYYMAHTGLVSKGWWRREVTKEQNMADSEEIYYFF